MNITALFLFLTLTFSSLAPAQSQDPPNDEFLHWQYYHEHLESISAWHLLRNIRQENIKVAICDTGVKADHEDLANRLEDSYDFFTYSTNVEVTHYHGTYLAGLIAANINNSTGIAGLAPNVNVMPLKVVSRNMNTSFSKLRECVRYAADKGAKVVLIALAPSNTRAMASLGRYARSRGLLLVTNAGNDGKRINRSNNDSLLVVAATSRNRGRWLGFGKGSNHGSFIDLAAPGHSLLSTVFYPPQSTKNGRYQYVSTTAGAAALAAGAAALVLSVNPNLTPLEVENILKSTASATNAPENLGAGIINVYKAIIAAQNSLYL